MGIKRRLGVTVDMARSVGVRAAWEQLRATAHEWFTAKRRARNFRRLKFDGPIVRDVLGSQMRLYPEKPGLDQDLIMHGIREPIATGHLMRLLQPDDVVLEAGANIGYYSLLESRLCRKVYAVEPHPENFERLQEHLEMNDVKNVEAYEMGFGPVDSDLHLQVSPLSNWHSCLGTSPGDEGVITVKGRTIDGFLAGREAPTFMRMDIEGFEVEALKGAQDTLRGLRGLFIELHGPNLNHDQIRATIDMIEGAGLGASLVVQYDWPGLARVYPPERIESIRQGDRCTYELFFARE